MKVSETLPFFIVCRFSFFKGLFPRLQLSLCKAEVVFFRPFHLYGVDNVFTLGFFGNTSIGFQQKEEFCFNKYWGLRVLAFSILSNEAVQ